MKIRKIFWLFAAMASVFAASVFAASLDNVQYPVPELGNCESREACRAFCDSEENHLACIGFAAKKELIEPKQAKQMEDLEKFQQGMESAFKDTPGSCVSPKECDAYCRVEDHLDECLSYSVKIGHASQEEAEKIKAQAKKGGPGGCKSKETCQNYCELPEHSGECMQFLVEEGKLTQEEASFAAEVMKESQELREQSHEEIDEKKAEEVLKTSVGPGGCKSTEECSKYCSGPEHMEECLKFAGEHGLVASQDVEKVKKLMQAGGPGGCKGKAECQVYCGKEENRQECMEFSLKNGTMSQEQYGRMMKLKEMMDKTGRPTSAAPGGCQSEEKCNEYCLDAAHIEECLDYARGGGRLSGEVVKNMMGKSEDARKKFEEMRKETEKFYQSEGGEGFPGGQTPPLEGGQFRPPEGFSPPSQQKDSNFPSKEGSQKDFKFPEGFTPPQGFIPPSGSEGKYSPPEGAMPPDGWNGMSGPPEGFVPPQGFVPREGANPGNLPPNAGGEQMAPPAGQASPEGAMPAPPPPGEVRGAKIKAEGGLWNLLKRWLGIKEF